MAQDATNTDLALIKLAREIAMDIQPLETILKHHSITDETWSGLQRNGRFLKLLSSEVEAWQTALNTHERVKLKSAAMLEEWLPELYARMNDRTEAMPATIEAGKMLSRIAGLEARGGDLSAALGERFSITINMGPAIESTFVKDVTPQELQANVIDIEPNPPKDPWGEASDRTARGQRG